MGTLKAGGTDNQKKMKVTGVVVDANGEPIIGANVWVKGTTSGRQYIKFYNILILYILSECLKEDFTI